MKVKILEVKKRSKKIRIPILIAFVAFLSILIPQNFFEIKASALKLSLLTNSAVPEINFSRIQSDVHYFSSLGSRVTGYPGCGKASDYIIETFKNLGLTVQIHEYYTPIPIDLGSWIIVDQGPYAGSNITAYALWPNAGVSTSKGVFSGKLYYAKTGTLKDLSGLDIQDSIILLDFNSGKNWLNAAKLGAKGVIFIEPPFTTKYEALSKGALAPINFPRLYVNATIGEMLKDVAQNNGRITIHLNMEWQNKKARNIIGILEGDAEHVDDVLILSAHYDSWSIVPAISPAAEDSLGVSVLLEMARYFKTHEHKQTLWFVAYSGHWEGRIGATEFIEDIILNTTKRTWLQIGIDISSQAPYLDLLYISTLYGSMTDTSGWGGLSWSNIYATDASWVIRYRWISSFFELFSNVPVKGIEGVHFPPQVQTLKDMVKVCLDTDRMFGTQDDFYILDTEPFLSTTGMAITFRTQYSRRESWLSPLNTSIIWENVWPQVITVGAIINGFANLDEIPYNWEDASPKRFIYVRGARPVGFSTLIGRTVEFSNKTGWYTGVPNVLVRLHIFEARALNAWPFAYQYAFSDNNGSFEFHGLVPYIYWILDAWKFDKSGSIEYVVDQGFFGTAQGVAGGLRNIVYPIGPTVSTLIPLFKCKEITIFDLIDLRTMRQLIERDYRNPNHNYFNEFRAKAGSINIYDAKSKTTPVFFGLYPGADEVACIYVKPESNIVITYTPNPSQVVWPMMILSNSSEDNPEGNGYLITEDLTIPITAYTALIDMYRMLENRYGYFYSFDIKSFYAEQMLEKARFFYIKANNSYVNKNYSDMYAETYLALQYLSKAYAEAVMPLFYEAAISVVFFSMLILPSSILFERLLIQWTSFKRFIGILSIMAIFFFAYSFVNPAFSVMSNSFMTVLSVGVLILVIAIVAIFLTDMKDLMETVRVAMLGEHVFRRGRVSVILHTLTSSVENMRKRPLLTSLVFILIICVTSAQTSFTSASYGFTIVKSQYAYGPPYNGILVKNIYGMPPESRGGVLSICTVRYLEGLAGEDYFVSPRVWMYPQPQSPEGMCIEIVTLDGKSYKISPSVFLGISSIELQLIFEGHLQGLDKFVGKYQCVLPSSIANTLDVKVGDSIYVRGIDANLTVVGITDLTENPRDFDGKFLTPIDPGFEYDLGLKTSQYSMTLEPFSMPIVSTIIVPWELALERGGFVSSIAIIPKSEKTLEEITEFASTIVSCTSLTAHISYENNSYGLQRIFTYVFKGWNATIAVLIALIILSILNFMFGTFIYRKKEIQTYSTLGLSPGGVFIIFLTEGITYGFGGALIGYLIGYAMNRVLLTLKFLPASYAFNFVSVTIVVSMFSIVASILAASIYPAFLAAKSVTPSLERKWKVSTKPVGDLWEIPIPLRIRRFEAVGVLRYFQEYFVGAGMVRSGFRVLEVSEVNTKDLELSLSVILTPIEQNITQTAILKFREEENMLQLLLILNRKTGDPKLWQNRNRAFIDDVRKQTLLWKSLAPSERSRYILSKRE